ELPDEDAPLVLRVTRPGHTDWEDRPNAMQFRSPGEHTWPREEVHLAPDTPFVMLYDMAVEHPGLAVGVGVVVLGVLMLGARQLRRSRLVQRLGEIQGEDTAVARRGQILGAYRLIEPVGRGACGVVWRAAGPDGEVAVKLVLGERPPEYRER